MSNEIHPKSDVTGLKVITFTFLFQNNEFPDTSLIG